LIREKDRVGFVPGIAPDGNVVHANPRREGVVKIEASDLPLMRRDAAGGVKVSLGPDDVTTPHVEVSGQTDQKRDGPMILDAVGMMGRGASTRHHAGRSGGSIQTGCLSDFSGRTHVIFSTSSGEKASTYSLSSSSPRSSGLRIPGHRDFL